MLYECVHYCVSSVASLVTNMSLDNTALVQLTALGGGMSSLVSRVENHLSPISSERWIAFVSIVCIIAAALLFIRFLESLD